MFLFDRDIDGGDPAAALGEFTTASDPTVPVETQCDLMIAEIKAQETRRRLATSTGAGSGSVERSSIRDFGLGLEHWVPGVWWP